MRACVRISSRTFVDGHRVALRFTDAMQIDLNCLGLKGRVPTTVNDLGRGEIVTGFAVSGVPQGLDDRMTCPATGRLDASCQESSGLWVFERWRFLTSERTRTSS